MAYNEKPRDSGLLTEPAEGPSLDAILEQETGRELYDISLEDVARSPAFNSELEGVEVAGIGGKLGRLFGLREIKAPKTDQMLKQGQEAAEKPPEFPEDMTPEQIQELTGEAETTEVLEPTSEEITQSTSPEFEPVDVPTAEDYVNQVQTYRGKDLETRTWQRNVNLDYVENPQDIGAVLEANAELFDMGGKRGYAQVEAEVDANAAELLAPVLQGKQNGLLNDRQMLAGRRLLVSMTNRVSELSGAIMKGNPSPEQVLQFEKLLSQTVMLQKYMQGQVRETARALSSMRINAKTLNSKQANAMVEAVDAGGTTKTAMMKAQIFQERMEAEGDELGNMLGLADELKDKSTVRALANYWASSILTGPKTQLTNFISNSFVQLMETAIIKPSAAAIGTARRMIPGQEGGVGFDEAGYEFMGMLTSFKDATLMASRVFLNGVKTGEYQSSYGTRKIDDITKQQPTLAEGLRINDVSKTAGAAVDVYQRMVEAGSYGLLTAGDEFFKTVAYRKALYAETARRGYEQGLSGDALAEFMNNQLNDIDDELHNAALAVSEKQTFTNDPQGFLGSMGKAFQSQAEKFPALKFVAPFISTPVNLFNYALEIGPTAVVTQSFREAIQKGGAEADIALAKLSLGSALYGAVYMYHEQGKITGGGPKNRQQLEAWEKLGVQPYSIKIGDKWVAYNRATDPLGMMISAVAGSMDEIKYARDEPTANKIAAGMIFAMAQYATEATYLQGIGQIMKSIDSGGVGADRLAARYLTGFIPRAVQTGAELMDETQRTTYPTNGFWDAMQTYTNAKVDRDELNPLRYWDGEIATSPYIYNTLSPINVSYARDDKASERMAANGVSVLTPKPRVNVMGVQIPLLESTEGHALYDKMLEYVGKERRRAVDSVVKARGFDKLESGPGTQQFLAINKALDAGRKAGMNKFINYLFKEVGKNTEKYGEIALLFDAGELESILKKAKRGTLSLEEEQLLDNVKIRGTKTRDELPVPGF